jgi:hypothetical protein
MKRCFAFLSLLATTAVVSAQTELGTKADPIGKTSAYQGGGNGLWPLLQMGLVLAVVLFVLKMAAPKLLSKLNKKLVTNLNGGLKIEESATFAGGTLYVVQARQKTLLLSAGANGVQCLADLTQEPIAPEQPLFMEMVDEQIEVRGDDQEPPKAAVYLEEEAPEEPAEIASGNPETDEVLAALDRLRRFSA